MEKKRDGKLERERCSITMVREVCASCWLWTCTYMYSSLFLRAITHTYGKHTLTKLASKPAMQALPASQCIVPPCVCTQPAYVRARRTEIVSRCLRSSVSSDSLCNMKCHCEYFFRMKCYEHTENRWWT